jgi:hypothetical protein
MIGTVNPRRPSSGTMSNVLRLLVMSVLVAGCALIEPQGPLVTLESRGGHCLEGECRATVVIDGDGRVHQIEPKPAEIHRVSGESIDVLRSALAGTDFEAIRSQPFTGVCPTAVDGQELIFTFATLAGPVRISTCELEIDLEQPLFVAVDAIVAGDVPRP